MTSFIENKLTGQTIVFLSESGVKDELVMKMSYNRKGTPPPMHYHSYQEEYFTVLSGQLELTMDGSTKKLEAGEGFVVPTNTPHAMWNGRDGYTEVKWLVHPALNTAAFFREAFELSNLQWAKGKSDLHWKDKIRLAYLFRKEIRLVGLPFVVVRVLFFVLFPLGFIRKEEKSS
ncbi:cupin domain-containing protein [Flavihumibacter sp. UBA7668]|uniref:cupin domain-containing protein n=1 Tax=Flavihumibacter sp. UBA7668 TaxID=1946542 RepID=UPI0025B7FA86|nr:cupin domain-containing protein [Flavihumibacter sp. UBA7668]